MCLTINMDRSPKLIVLVSLGTGILIGLGLMTAASVLDEWEKTKPSAVETLTAGQLAAYCRDVREPSVVSFCSGFIGGTLNGRSDVAACLPADWSIAEAQNQFLAWIDLHPKHRDNPAADEVIRAQPIELRCRKGGKHV